MQPDIRPLHYNGNESMIRHQTKGGKMLGRQHEKREKITNSRSCFFLGNNEKISTIHKSTIKHLTEETSIKRIRTK